MLEAWNQRMLMSAGMKARQINDCEYLFAQIIREIEELTLEVIITEAKAQAEILVPRDSTEVEQLLSGSRPIQQIQHAEFSV